LVELEYLYKLHRVFVLQIQDIALGNVNKRTYI